MPLFKRPPRCSKAYCSRAIIGWILYDWANSAFALSVMAAFFPVFFKKYYCAGQEASFSTIRLNLGNAIAGLCIALLGPLLGSVADAAQSRKRFLLAFMLLGVWATAILSLVNKGDWIVALAVFIVANIGFSVANLFYDSLLPLIAPHDRLDSISSYGYAFGYLGCALLFLINLFMVNAPTFFGCSDSVHAIRISFLTVALWWFFFSLPLWLWVKEPKQEGEKRCFFVTLYRSLLRLKDTFCDIRRRKRLWLFLLAYWLYIDGVHTFIRAAADLGLSIGIDDKKLLSSLLIVQVVAFPAAYLFGLAAQRFGAVRMLTTGICIYLFVTLIGPLTVSTALHFGLFAALQAIPLGALQALSRSHFARLIPAESTAEYFGFYDIVGKFAVATGPAVVAMVVAIARRLGATPSTAVRLGCTSLSIFFIVGAVLLCASAKNNGSSPPSVGE